MILYILQKEEEEKMAGDLLIRGTKMAVSMIKFLWKEERK